MQVTRRAARRLAALEGPSPLVGVFVLESLLTLALILMVPSVVTRSLWDLWLIAVLAACYLAWHALVVRGLVAADTAVGIHVAIFGLAARFIHEICFWRIPAHWGWGYSGLSLADLHPEGHFRFLDWPLRAGGLAAFVLGLALAGWAGWQDIRRRAQRSIG